MPLPTIAEQAIALLHAYARADGVDDGKITLDGGAKTLAVTHSMSRAHTAACNARFNAAMHTPRDTACTAEERATFTALNAATLRSEKRAALVTAINTYFHPDYWMLTDLTAPLLKGEVTLKPDADIKAAFDKALARGFTPEALREAVACSLASGRIQRAPLFHAHSPVPDSARTR